jgi:hypothetical protein
MSEHETRLVPMMEVRNPKGRVLRYTHPYDVGAEEWWGNGITEDQRALALHCVEAHAAFAPDHELDDLRNLQRALRGDIPNE